MFNLFTKKFWHHFYLPSELYHLVEDINTDTISFFFKNENISFSKLKIYNISTKLIYISIAFEDEKSICQFQNYISKFKELFPPWEIFPNMFQGSPRWNQGTEEDYGAKTWLPFWESLTAQEKDDYLDKFTCPIEWREWLNVSKS